ncbi:2OG-Fe(II) oxygenase [Hyphomicrobiales bacterium]|nr:2OG-Fe(II) oxygenase [Hyphomicrobiales bacterium]
MKKINITTKTNNHFIGCWNIEQHSLMDEMVSYFEDNPEMHELGVSGLGDRNKETKESIDISLKPNDLKLQKMDIFNRYFRELNKCYWDYINQWEFLKQKWGEMYIGPFNIQKYNVGGHFKKWHTERDSIASSHRVLAWMTYLNDVESGHTDFKHFDMSIKPEKGKTLIWPAEWTHAHRGQEVKKEKYIITGWFHFPSSATPLDD